MEKISITPFVRDKLDELILTLYKDDYFSYLENSEAYVRAIYGFLYSIPELKHYPPVPPVMAAGIAGTNPINKQPGSPLLIKNMIFTL